MTSCSIWKPFYIKTGWEIRVRHDVPRPFRESFSLSSKCHLSGVQNDFLQHLETFLNKNGVGDSCSPEQADIDISLDLGRLQVDVARCRIEKKGLLEPQLGYGSRVAIC